MGSGRILRNICTCMYRHSSLGRHHFAGQIANHNVVVACHPSGNYETTSAAIVAQQTFSTFWSIQFGFRVGIGVFLDSQNLWSKFLDEPDEV